MDKKANLDKEKLFKLNFIRVKSLISLKCINIVKYLLCIYSIVMVFVSLIDVITFIILLLPSLLSPNILLCYIFQLIIQPISSLIFGISAYDNVKQIYEVSSDARDIFPTKALNDLKQTLIFCFVLNCFDFIQLVINCLVDGFTYNHWFTSNWIVTIYDFGDYGIIGEFGFLLLVFSLSLVFLVALGVWCYCLNNMAQTLILNSCSSKIFGKKEANALIISSFVLLVIGAIYSAIKFFCTTNIFGVILLIFFIIIELFVLIASIRFGTFYIMNIEDSNAINRTLSSQKEDDFDGKDIYIENFTEYKKDTMEYNPDNYSKIKIDIYGDKKSDD